MSQLAAQEIVVKRGGRLILDKVDAAFGAGGFTAIIGPNGAGKSTLMSVLAGLLAPDSGRVTLDGTPLAQIPRRTLARRRAYLPQNARSEWPITVERVVALGLTPTLSPLRAIAASEAARIDAALATCDLTTFRDQPVTTLSGGELARTMLARAVVGDPDILMADEPTAGLDPRHALDAMRRLRALAEAGRTVIVAIHDLALALPFADRVLALRAGACIADGPAADTVNADLLKRLYDVDARVERDGEGLSIRFLER